MRSAATIFLLAILVFTQTPVGQLLRLPLLVEHFMGHQKKDGVSFRSFLEDHYSSDHNDADSPEDDKLPFKSIKFYSVGYAIVPSAIKANAIAPAPVDKKIVFTEVYAPHRHLVSIFRPPRV